MDAASASTLDAVDMLPAPLWHHIFRRLLLPPSQPDDLLVPPDTDRTGSERHRRDADIYGASWPLLCCALTSKSLLQHVLSFSENQPISLICNHHDPQWMDNIRFFLHHGGLHSLDLTFTTPEHVDTLGPLIARSSASLTSLGLELHGWHIWQDRKGLGFLKDCLQLQRLKLGRGKWKLNGSCANAAWVQSLRSLTLTYMQHIELEHEFLDAITPQLTEFTLYQVSHLLHSGTIRHSFSFSNARILRFLFQDTKLFFSLNLAASLTTLSVMGGFVELTCHSDSPFALHQLLLYARSELRTSLLCFASVKVIYLDAHADYQSVCQSLQEFSTDPPSQDIPSASSDRSWMSWLHTVAPTVEVLIVEHVVPFTEMNVEWHSLRSLGIVVLYSEGGEIDKDRETSVEGVYRLNTLDEREFDDGIGYADDPDPDELMGPPSIKAPNLEALFFPSEGFDGDNLLATLKHNYPSLGLYSIVDRTFYWERKGVRLINAPLVHVRGKKGGRETGKPSKTVKEKMHSVNKHLIKGYSVDDEEAYMLKVERELKAFNYQADDLSDFERFFLSQV